MSHLLSLNKFGKKALVEVGEEQQVEWTISYSLSRPYVNNHLVHNVSVHCCGTMHGSISIKEELDYYTSGIRGTKAL